MSDAYTSSDEDDLYDEEDFNSNSTGIESEETEVDIEAYHFACITIEYVDKLFVTAVNDLMEKITLSGAGVARILLHHFQWDCQKVVKFYKNNPAQALKEAKIRCKTVSPDYNSAQFCQTCFLNLGPKEFRSLDCGHQFCADCWTAFLEVEVGQGRSTDIACMGHECDILAPMEFSLQLIAPKSALLEARYRQLCRNDWIRSHPQLRCCPGKNCQAVVMVESIQARCVKCSFCQTTYCCRCGDDYHAPADCDTMKQWTTKCHGDAETANYITVNTKDCPKCHVSIEKNGGCNHMSCSRCKHEFCWLCFGDWKKHGSQDYVCSRYKEDPNIEQARDALKKYLFYFERWETHANSLRLEDAMREKIQIRINQKVMAKEGTWIDWQYLLDAAALLAKCRYTLRYTYPYAYSLESGPRKELFEYQQASLEAEIENLSWALERAETTQRGELGNQMKIAEKRRKVLLNDFLGY